MGQTTERAAAEKLKRKKCDCTIAAQRAVARPAPFRDCPIVCAMNLLLPGFLPAKHLSQDGARRLDDSFGCQGYWLSVS